MINEFDQVTRESEMEALSDFVPQFQKAPLEPFLASAQQDVVPPRWNKIDLGGFFPLDEGSGAAGSDLELVQCVIGVQEGGSFVPKLAFVVGPVTDL